MSIIEGGRVYPTTLEEIEAVEGDVLYTWQVVKYLKSSEDKINCAAKAGLLPWAYKIESRTVIPKRAFVNYHKYGQVSCGTVKNPLLEIIKI